MSVTVEHERVRVHDSHGRGRCRVYTREAFARIKLATLR